MLTDLDDGVMIPFFSGARLRRGMHVSLYYFIDDNIDGVLIAVAELCSNDSAVVSNPARRSLHPESVTTSPAGVFWWLSYHHCAAEVR